MPTSVSSEVSLTPSNVPRLGGDGRSSVALVVIVGAIDSELYLVDGGGGNDALVLQNDVGGNMRNHVVAAQGIRGIVDVGVVDVIAEEHRSWCR